MTTIIAFVFVLGVLVFVHEFGHFIVAKMCGVGVYTFAIGFGKKIWGFQYGETYYQVGMFPLGGYVKMVGQSDDLTEDERDIDMPPESNFNAHPLWHRFAIVLAGPLMNIIFAYAVAPAIFWTGIEEENWRQEAPVVGYLEPGSLAALAGLQQGDTILSIANTPVKTWLEVYIHGQMAGGNTISIVALHNGLKLQWKQPVETTEYLPDLFPFKYSMPAVVGEIMPDSSAALAGLEAGDTIVAVNQTPVKQFPEIGPIIQKAKGDPVTLSVIRQNKLLQIELSARQESESGRWLIGIARSDETHMERYGFVTGIQRGIQKTNRLIGFTLDVVVKLFTGQLGLKTVGGPIMIAQAAGNAAEQGFAYLLSLMIFISIQLGILNLLPIPVLDGGHLAMFTYEAIARRPPNEKAIEWMSRAGFAMLILLMVVATTNDIVRVFGSTIGKVANWLGVGS